MRALLSGLVVSLGLVLASGAKAQSIEIWAALPEISQPSLSADGRWLSTRCVSQGNASICINDLTTGELSYVIPVPAESWVVDAYFASNDHFLVSLAFQQQINTSEGMRSMTVTRAMAIRPETGENTLLMRGQRWSTDTSNIASLDLDDPENVLVEMRFLRRPEVSLGSRMASRETFESQLFRVNLDSGDVRHLDTNDLYSRVIDAYGETRAVILFDPVNREFEIRRDRERGELLYAGVHESDAPSVMGMTDESGLLVFFQVGENRGYRRLDLQTGDVTAFATPEINLLTAPIFDRENYLVGFEGEMNGVSRQSFIDEGFRNDVSALQGVLGVPVRLETYSADRDLVLISTDESARPKSYFLYQRSAGALSPVGDTYPGLAEVALPERRSFVYQAADGLNIEAIVTTPAGWQQGQEALPMVVLPHGGPAARDSLGFDWWAQAYAAQGYVVIQPNFRGSDGYGRGFREAGFGEFGGRMIEDILDGGRALQAAGIARSGQFCVAGGSYGGYAALMAGITAPQDVACVIAFAPVTNPSTMLREERNVGEFTAYHFWEQYMGNILWDTEAASAVSPVRRASELTMPTLVLHGTEDSVVPIEESEVLTRAMGRDAPDYEFIELDGETHFFVLSQSRQILLERSLELMERTLRQPD
ncbi:alpha/beta hydrolase family protein [Maricaulis sp. D1M11]|uniref:alpha/beta hydrolase family protein n=1 Tax=Maricaulis sp. D1M11 TaxID=3076117 RepID=UPI0039B4EEE6